MCGRHSLLHFAVVLVLILNFVVFLRQALM